MKSRNLFFLRSVLFGLGTKLAGALTVFIGIPLISRSLNVNDYARFLQLMSAGSALAIFFNAAGAISTRYIAHSIGKESEFQEHLDRSLGLFCLIAALFSVTEGVAFLINKADALLLFTLFLNTICGLLAWGDAYRVATRSDHLSSIFQLIGNIFLICLLVGLSNQGLLFVTSAYFGIPLSVQLLIFAHIAIEAKRVPTPKLSLGGLWEQARGVGVIVFNSGVEYAKIFGSGLVVQNVSGNSAYALYTTTILLVARFVNPLSLITRPLMPAFIDATRQKDIRWIRMLAIGLVLVSIASLAGALGASYLVKSLHLYRFLPGILSSTQPDLIVWIMLFLWGHAFSTFILPLYVSTHREKTFSAINAAMVFCGLSCGYLFLKAGHSNAMLISISLSTFAGSGILILVAIAVLTTHIKGWERTVSSVRLSR